MRGAKTSEGEEDETRLRALSDVIVEQDVDGLGRCAVRVCVGTDHC